MWKKDLVMPNIWIYDYIGILVKTIPWEHAEQIAENTVCKPHGNPFEFMVLHSRERTDKPKGYASGR